MKTSQYDTTKGVRLKRWFRATMGHYLREERLKRNLTIEELSQHPYIPCSPQSIESVELGCGNTQWHTMCTLLKFYRKEVQITLTERNAE